MKLSRNVSSVLHRIYVDKTNTLHTCNSYHIKHIRKSSTNIVIRDCKSPRNKTDTLVAEKCETQKRMILQCSRVTRCTLQVYRKAFVTSRYRVAGWNDSPGRWSETVIVQSLQNAQIGYQRILPHAAAPIHTRFHVSTVLSAPLVRPAPREEEEKIFARTSALSDFPLVAPGFY